MPAAAPTGAMRRIDRRDRPNVLPSIDARPAPMSSDGSSGPSGAPVPIERLQAANLPGTAEGGCARSRRTGPTWSARSRCPGSPGRSGRSSAASAAPARGHDPRQRARGGVLDGPGDQLDRGVEADDEQARAESDQHGEQQEALGLGQESRAASYVTGSWMAASSRESRQHERRRRRQVRMPGQPHNLAAVASSSGKPTSTRPPLWRATDPRGARSRHRRVIGHRTGDEPRRARARSAASADPVPAPTGAAATGRGRGSRAAGSRTARAAVARVAGHGPQRGIEGGDAVGAAECGLGEPGQRAARIGEAPTIPWRTRAASSSEPGREQLSRGMELQARSPGNAAESSRRAAPRRACRRLCWKATPVRDGLVAAMRAAPAPSGRRSPGSRRSRHRPGAGGSQHAGQDQARVAVDGVLPQHVGQVGMGFPVAAQRDERLGEVTRYAGRSGSRTTASRRSTMACGTRPADSAASPAAAACSPRRMRWSCAARASNVATIHKAAVATITATRRRTGSPRVTCAAKGALTPVGYTPAATDGAVARAARRPASVSSRQGRPCGTT